MAETTYQDWSDDHPAAALTGTEILLVDQGPELVGTTTAAVAAVGVTPHAADTTAIHGIADTAALVVTTDPRLTNARTPTAHAASHAVGGTDVVQITQAQVTDLTIALAAKQTASPVLTELTEATQTGRRLLTDTTGELFRAFLGAHCMRQWELPVANYAGGGGWQTVAAGTEDDFLFDGYLQPTDPTSVTSPGNELILDLADQPTGVPLTLETVGAYGPDAGIQTWEWFDDANGWVEILTFDAYLAAEEFDEVSTFATLTVSPGQTAVQFRMAVNAKNPASTGYQAKIQHVRLRLET